MTDGKPDSACEGCGRTWPFENGPNATHCGDCPPWRCDRCDRMVDMAEHLQCDCVCWFKDMAFADIKSALAGIDLSVDFT